MLQYFFLNVWRCSFRSFFQSNLGRNLWGLHDRELCYLAGFNRKGTIVGNSEVDEVVKTGIFWTGVAIKWTLGLERLRQELWLGHPWQGVYDLDGHDRTLETEMAVAELLPTTVTKSLHLWQDSGGSHNRPSGTAKIEIWHLLRQQALAVGSNPETGVPIIGSIKQLQRKTYVHIPWQQYRKTQTLLPQALAPEATRACQPHKMLRSRGTEDPLVCWH